MLSHPPEPLLGRDRATIVTGALLLVLAAAAWMHVVVASTLGSAHDAGMEAMSSGTSRGVAFVVAWGVMMAAMMLPSALPMIALYAATRRGAAGGLARGVPVALFALVYLALWTVAGLPVYLASLALERIAAEVVPYGVALILLAAGAYQLSPLKQVCLRNCRSPLGFLLGHWRAGYRGSLAMGWSHAVYCLGCCWALMVVLVAAGAMGLAWVLLVAAAVAAEKLSPRGEWIARLIGVALVLLGAAVAVRPDIAAALRGGHVM